MSNIKIRGIQHLGIPVTNLERSLTFYQKIGFTCIYTTNLPPENGDTRVAMIQNDCLTIELYQFSGEERDEIAQRSDGHIDHIALDVEDIHITLDQIEVLGLEILEPDAPVFLPFWDHGVAFFTIRGPDSEKVEFTQILTSPVESL